MAGGPGGVRWTTGTAAAIAMVRRPRLRAVRPTVLDAAAFVVGGVILAVLVVPAVASAANAPERLGPGVSVPVATIVSGVVIVTALLAAVTSGARGGPLSLATPTVVLVLLAPVDRAAVLRWPATRQLLLALGVGAVVAGVAWIATSREVVSARGSPGVWILAGSLAGIACAGIALAAAGLRLSPRASAVTRAVVAGWWLVDAVFGTTTSPMAALARVPFEGLTLVRIAYVAVAAVGLAVLGVLTIGGLSVEKAMRRSGAADQLRVAVGLNDLRTAVLILRRRASEAPRLRPWRSVEGGWARRFPIATRSARALLRWPVSRIVRFTALAGAAGAVTAASVGYVALGALAASLIYLGALDAVDALAQELDHPDLQRGYPISEESLAARHLAVPLAVMTAFGALAGGVAGVIAGPRFGLIAVVVSPIVAIAALAGATLTATRTARPFTRISDIGLPPEALGPKIIARVAAPIVPLAATIVPVVPVAASGRLGPAVLASLPGGLVSVGVLVGLLHRSRLERLVHRWLRWAPVR